MSERKVATDALETLGTILDNNQKRDAIHLAVEPVEAGETLFPGAHITVKNGKAFKTKVGEGLGVVDPFLPGMVEKGQRFWFVMYPRMVHSLRHVWTHPSFPDEVADVPPGSVGITKQTSETWLREWCAAHDCPDYETVMELIEGKLTLADEDRVYYSSAGTYDSDYLHFNGTDAHGEIPMEFWEHVENVLGKKVKYHPTYLSCSC